MTTRRTTPVPTRRCIGSRTFGIEPHDAPVSDFPVQPSRRDGLGALCRAHRTVYTRSLRQAARERRETVAEGGPVPAHGHTLAASVVGKGAPIEAPTGRQPRRPRTAAPIDPGADAA